MQTNDQTIDSERTTAEAARELLEKLCEEGFDGSTEKLALALGRNEDEITGILDGEEETDEDLLLKIRGIARERDLELE